MLASPLTLDLLDEIRHFREDLLIYAVTESSVRDGEECQQNCAQGMSISSLGRNLNVRNNAGVNRVTQLHNDVL